MKPVFLSLLSAALLSGCSTMDEAPEEITMPQMQQNTYLSHAKPPQQFGFSVVALDDGITYSGSSRLHPNHSATLKMSRNQIPVVEIRGRSRRDRMNALIDLSSPSSWLEFSKAREFEAQFMGKHRRRQRVCRRDHPAAHGESLRGKHPVLHPHGERIDRAARARHPLAAGGCRTRLRQPEKL
jgi:hypothetical protein